MQSTHKAKNLPLSEQILSFNSVANSRDFFMLFTDFSMQNSVSQVRCYQYSLLISEHIEIKVKCSVLL